MDQITLEKITNVLQKTADSLSIELISVRYYTDEQMGKVLEVLIDKDYSISMEQIEEYTNAVNPLLDEVDDSEEGYMLDISSGGSVRKIPFDDVGRLIDRYLDIKLKKSGETITAKVLSFEDQVMKVVYFIKGRRKQLELTKEDVETIHMGYKA